MAVIELRASQEMQTGLVGDFCPYWTQLRDKVFVADSAEEIFPLIPPERRLIDPVALTGLLQFNYMLGNRTLVQGVNRMPWRATLNGKGQIRRRPPIPHGKDVLCPQAAAAALGERLRQALNAEIRKFKSVYLLLTGGLDSRVLAGILRNIQKGTGTTVNAVTWGDTQSRDFAYAKRIAGWYNWNFIHVPFGAEETWENIKTAAIWGGAEVSGIHLHGMSWFKQLSKEALVIAGIFGDSVGRAEFSSRHLTKLQLLPIRNTMDLLNKRFATGWIRLAEQDRQSAWAGLDSDELMRKCELDMHENYLRRMLVHVFNHVNRYAGVHLPFANPEVVGFMWSLAPGVRNNEIYFALLKNLDEQLYNLPWAKNGVSPSGLKETDDTLLRHYHHRGKWLRRELSARIKPCVFSPELRRLGLINQRALANVWERWISEDETTMGLTELVAKICSIEIARAHYNLRSDLHGGALAGIQDLFTRVFSPKAGN